MTDKFIVQGQDGEGNYDAGAEGAPFAIFCPAIGDWLPGQFASRDLAEFARTLYERQNDYIAVVEFAHVKLYRLGGEHQSEVWGGNGRIPPIATFTNVGEFETFTGKTLAEFNNLVLTN